MPAARVRVTGGSARGIPLVEPRGHRLRPTSGLVREALFNILGADVEDARVLDLYAGTGALGIEALSRGAASATFIESNAQACRAILDSLSRTGFQDVATVLRGALPGALSAASGPFDIIMLDPPYDDVMGAEALLVGLTAILAPGGTVVYEHSSRYNPPQHPTGLTLMERRVYGDSALALYRREEAE
jgi:16S rRNA (guanine(966)-N(2))-methyltransferase RsmD